MTAQAVLRDVSRTWTGPSAAGEPLEALFLTAPVRDRRAVADGLRRQRVRFAATADLNVFSRLAADHPVSWALIDLLDETQSLAGVRVMRARQPLVHLVGLVDATSAVTAGQARLAGIADLLPWPIEPEDLAAFVADVRDRTADPTHAGANADAHGEAPIACSTAMQDCVRAARRAARTGGGVIVVGERGAGRRVLARAMHRWSGATGPLVEIDADAGDPAEVEAQLLGRLAGAGPRAAAQSLERIDRGSAMHAAIGGTLFVAHVSTLSSKAQARLARILRDGEARLEDGSVIDVRVRVMASDTDLDAADPDGRLRHDLRDQIGRCRIDVPPLRARRADIPSLAAQALRHAPRPSGAGPVTFSRSALTLLTALPWSGNGHELQASVTALVQACPGPVIGIEDVLALASLDGATATSAAPAGELTLRDAKVRFERECISRVLERHHGRMGDAARALGIQRTNLYRKVRQLNLDRSLRAARK